MVSENVQTHSVCTPQTSKTKENSYNRVLYYSSKGSPHAGVILEENPQEK